MFKKGSEGHEVRLIQSFLKSLGYRISVDGEFGKETDSAVRQYQRDKKLFIDGEVGNETIGLMKAEGFLFSDERGAAVAPELLTQFRKRLKYHAEEFEGYVEISNNSKWDDPDQAGWQKETSDKLMKYMLQIKNWSSGAPYCAAAVGAFVVMSLEDCKLSTEKFLSIWTAHVMTNVRMAKFKNILSIVPSLDSVWLAKFGETDKGHTGIVFDISGDHLITIEANTMAGATDDSEKQRSGDGIYRRRFHKSGRGSMKTQGFISSENILKFFVS